MLAYVLKKIVQRGMLSTSYLNYLPILYAQRRGGQEFLRL